MQSELWSNFKWNRPLCAWKNKPKDRLANSRALGRYQSEEHVLAMSVCFKWPWQETLLEMTNDWGRHHCACSRSFLPMIRLSICTRIKELQIHLHSMAQEEYRTQKSVRRKRPTKRNKLGVGERFMCKQRKHLVSSAPLRSILESHNMV